MGGLKGLACEAAGSFHKNALEVGAGWCIRVVKGV